MISFFVAMDENGVIGKNNALPWHLPADLAYFKAKTTGHTIVMGRKTYESIGRPLPNRRNIILTNNKQFTQEGCIVIHTVKEVLKLCKHESETFVIGGSEIYRAFLPYVQRLYITCLHHTFEGDTYFPTIDLTQWKLVSKQKGKRDEKNQFDYSFLIYEK